MPLQWHNQTQQSLGKAAEQRVMGCASRLGPFLLKREDNVNDPMPDIKDQQQRTWHSDVHGGGLLGGVLTTAGTRRAAGSSLRGPTAPLC